MITLLTDTKEPPMSKKSRGRDVTITTGNVPLNPTRLIGVSPLGVPFAVTPAIAPATPTRSPTLPSYSVKSLPTPPNRVATATPRNDNLYRPAQVTKEVSICANRHIRREVIFATGKGGRNGMKHARFTPNSKVKC